MSDDTSWNRPRWVKLALGVGVAAVIAAECVVLVTTLHPDDDPPRVPPMLARAVTDPPVDLAPVGSHVRSEVQSDGTIRVTQWIRTAAVIDRITLAPYDLGDGVEAPVATDLDVVDGEGRVVVSGGEVGADPRVISLDAPVRLLRLTYDLVDAVELSGSVAGRGLAGMAALDVDVGGEGPTTVQVTGSTVLNLACAQPGASLRPCGRPGTSGWSVTLAGKQRDDRVVVQVDLPPRAAPA